MHFVFAILTQILNSFSVLGKKMTSTILLKSKMLSHMMVLVKHRPTLRFSSYTTQLHLLVLLWLNIGCLCHAFQVIKVLFCVISSRIYYVTFRKESFYQLCQTWGPSDTLTSAQAHFFTFYILMRLLNSHLQVVGYEEDLSGRQMLIDRVRTRSSSMTPSSS